MLVDVAGIITEVDIEEEVEPLIVVAVENAGDDDDGSDDDENDDERIDVGIAG